MKNYFIWNHLKLKDCSFAEILNCIKYCWYVVPIGKQKKLRKKLIKIANKVAKYKYEI